MAESLKETLEETGHKIAETATKVGHRVEEKAEEAADWAKEKAHQVGNRIDEATAKAEHAHGAPHCETGVPDRPLSGIREHMDVYASCGKWVGRVDHVEGDTIKLTKKDSPDGQHHRIPLSWVSKVHDHVHLDRDHVTVQSEWQSA